MEWLHIVGFGVCDSPEQLARKFPKFVGTVWLALVRRINQPSEDGWRWLKWGEYVGEYDISNVEYLSECDGKDGRPLIDVQYVFSTTVHKNSVSISLEPYEAYTLECGRIESTGVKLQESSFSQLLKSFK
jgi:hypothetical protein